MKKEFLKITVVCAACSMLTASAWAQAESPSQQPGDSSTNRSWSTKHLSATGRDNEHTVRSSQLSGAAVNDASGKRIATIEDTIINPVSGRVDFALLSLDGAAEASSSTDSGNGSSTTSPSSANVNSPNKLIPVPWTLLKTSGASSQYVSSSPKPTFTLNNVDQSKLTAAPSVSASELSQSEWQQRVYSYYGVTPGVGAMGGAESPTGQIKGEGARHMENSTPDRQPTQP